MGSSREVESGRMIENAFKHIEGNGSIPRITCFLSLVLLLGGFHDHALAFAVSFENPRDTVLIDGHIINITANVEVDTVWKRPEKSVFRKWLDGAEFIALARAGAEIGGDDASGNDFYVVKNEIRFPEFSLEAAHPFGDSFQWYYRGGVSMGLSQIFDEESVNESAIGFEWDGLDVLEVYTTDVDVLGNEYDTIPAPITFSPKLKLALGVEWHGVMRAAEGWIWGAQLEWLPKKNEFTKLYPTPEPGESDPVSSDLTYEIILHKTNALQLRTFTSWSAWNSPWFLRAEVCWAPTSTTTWVALGVRW
jgi:hypothetical protein